MPKISVIVPVYKVEKYIHRCVDSILNQTFTDFELILVDDGSPDNCGAICDEYAQKDGRVVVIHQENGGLSAARNAGIDWAFANSDSEWLTFIASDDWVHPEYLNFLQLATAELEVKISSCSITEAAIDKLPVFCAKKYETEEAYCCDTLNFNRISACGKLYFKQLWRDVRFPMGKIHEDRFTTHKLLFQVTEIAAIELPLYHYTANQNSITRSEWSPKRLDDIEAVEEQICFFQTYGYLKAKTRIEKSALYVICKMLDEVKTSKYAENKKYIRFLTRKLRFHIKKSKKDLGLSPKTHSYFYEHAYPKRMFFYWSTIALRNKVK